MGGSTSIPLDIRVQVWLEMVPALMNELNVEHISLLPHCAGSIYALNAIVYLRELLNPERPYIALIAPWVHHKQSQVRLMKLASMLPVRILDRTSILMKFAATELVPPLARATRGESKPGRVQKKQTSWNEVSEPASPQEIQDESNYLKMVYVCMEDISALEEEAKLCLKKSKANT